MKKKLHVGNLSSRATEEGLRFLFSQKGEIIRVELITERTTGRSRAFAFITMATLEGATAALQGLHLHIWNGRHITVNEARAEEPGAETLPPAGRLAVPGAENISPFFPIKTRIGT
jgi:cold-inducible RNA-binding protein